MSVQKSLGTTCPISTIFIEEVLDLSKFLTLLQPPITIIALSSTVLFMLV